jgi:hypothetical protein
MTARTFRGSYPHPVLDASDDVASYFDVSNVLVSPTIEDICVTFDVRTDDPTLKHLMATGEARLSLRWRCSATLASGEHEPHPRMTLADGHKYESWIDQREVHGTVDADIRVLAMEPLSDFHWERQHPDYGDAVFDLRMGDVLAEGGSLTFEAYKLYDPLNPPIGSCFRFMEDPRLHRGIRVTFEEDDAILVRLSPDVHRNLRLLTPRTELQISSVVLPALIQTISYIQRTIKDNSEDLSDRIWFKAINDKVSRLGGFDDSDALEIAQKILDYPVDRTLSTVAEAEEDDE